MVLYSTEFDNTCWVQFNDLQNGEDGRLQSFPCVKNVNGVVGEHDELTSYINRADSDEEKAENRAFAERKFGMQGYCEKGLGSFEVEP